MEKNELLKKIYNVSNAMGYWHNEEKLWFWKLKFEIDNKTYMTLDEFVYLKEQEFELEKLQSKYDKLLINSKILVDLIKEMS